MIDNKPAITLEIPMNAVMGFYTQPREFNPPAGINYVLYAGWPGSALNGGRVNGVIDDPYVTTSTTGIYTDVSAKHLQYMKQYFLECAENANQKGQAFFLAYTNFFAFSEAFNDDNALPLDRLAESGQRHGVRNGVVLANDDIRAWAKSIAGDGLDYICSCTKVYTSERRLEREQRIDAYKKALDEFDYVIIAPPDSSIEPQLDNIPVEARARIITVADSPCPETCNGYWHYAGTSALNILTTIGKDHPEHENYDSFAKTAGLKKIIECNGSSADLLQRIDMLLSKGYRHFKIGRSPSMAQMVMRVGAAVAHLTSNDTSQAL